MRDFCSSSEQHQGICMANVKLQGLAKSFGDVRVLRDVSLDVHDGEFLTLLGPSGCGKSTLLRIIAGLERQTAGSVIIGDRAVDNLAPKHRDVAMVFQTYALYPHMTVAANLSLPLVMRRMSSLQRLPMIGSLMPGARAQKAAVARDVQEVATSLELQDLLERKPGQLSGGQRQRVALARAMVRHPAVFLMDEPLSNLDAKLRAQMRTEITGLRRKLAATFVYVTHDQLEAMTMSDRVAVMFEGRIVQLGSPQALYSQPATRQVAEFIGSPRINLIEATAQSDGIVFAADTQLPIQRGVPSGTKLTLGIRPESLHLAERGGAGVFTGRVQRTEYVGSDLLVYFHVLGQAEHLVLRTIPRSTATALRADTSIHVTVPRDQLLIFDNNGDALKAELPPVTQLRSHR
jgi:multiple sugar transport system ATP-binding protein